MRTVLQSMCLDFMTRHRHFLRLAAATIGAGLLFVLAGPATEAGAAVWSSTDRFGTFTAGNYTLFNNVWGSGFGPQTIWANSTSNWGVWANHPDTSGVKAYPNVTRNLGRKLSATGKATSTFDVTVPTSGVAFTTAYDIWSSDNANEIMLWMNKSGAVGPLGSRQTSVTVGGHSWDAFRGSNGSNQVISLVRTANTSSGTVDIRAILNWIRSKGWIGDITIGNVQFGFEITSSSGGKDFITNSFAVSSSA
jgi:hypothetical protein